MPSPASSYSSNAPSRPSNTQISRAGSGKSAAHCAPSATGSRLPARTNTGKRSSGVATRIRRPPSRYCSVNRSYQPPGGSATSVASPPSASGRTTGFTSSASPSMYWSWTPNSSGDPGKAVSIARIIGRPSRQACAAVE